MLPPSLPAAGTTLSDDEIRQSRDLYVAKCAKCHRFYDPSRYPEAEWRSWMKKMSRKSRLSLEEEDRLTRFLGEFRRATPADGRL